MHWRTLALLVLATLTLAAAPATRPTTPTPGLHQPYRITPRPASQQLDLSGPWQLGWRDAAIDQPADLSTITKWIPATVPTTVQWALHRAGEYPHPYENLSSKHYSWVDEKVWYYRRTFTPPAIPAEGSAFLCFEGIDYFARVWLNGQLLGEHQGMFAGPTIEVGRQLKPGVANELLVEVRAGNWGNKKGYKPRSPGATIKPWVIAGGTGGEMFFPLGLWQGVRLVAVPAGHMERPFLITRTAAPDRAQLELNLEVFAGTHSLQSRLHPWGVAQLDNHHSAWTSRPSKSTFALQVQLLDKRTNTPAFDQRFPLQLVAGRNWVKQSFDVANPRLWWPNGLGDASLYTARLTLFRNDQPEDVIAFDYGIRTLKTVPTPGPQTTDRWANWQFVVNDRPFFVKGINWMPADILLDLPRERYRWLLTMAKASGIQMLRVWGGGIIETEEFYDLCNELGLLVWQDFPIGNGETPLFPQDVWEAQVLHTIWRIRNHPSLALYCGGNEFNPYAVGNAQTIGILERSVAQFDNTRPFRRTSPDEGSIHTYPDMDPTWYHHVHRLAPYVAETGMHNIPDPANMREVVDNAELSKPLARMFDKSFPAQHPDLMHHFVEYDPNRVPRMLSRASHIDDMTSPMLDALAEATQIGAGEFYQIFSEQFQSNYPVTAGLMPWVYKRPWPVIAIMLVDGFGHPTAPYYFLKRTYEPTHVMVRLPHLMWAKGEQLPIHLQVLHALPSARENLRASVSILDASFVQRWRQEQVVSVKAGPSVTTAGEWNFSIPAEFEETFFFVVAELHSSDGSLISRSVYWPRCLKRMADPTFAAAYRATPKPTPTFEQGPWLKPQSAAHATTLELSVLDHKPSDASHSTLRIRIRNTGKIPAMNVHLDLTGTRRSFYATDNYFWLAAGQERELTLEILWRDPANRAKAELLLKAWNAKTSASALKN